MKPDRLFHLIQRLESDKSTTQPNGAGMNKWTPTTNLLELRRLGKTCEELGELVAVLGRTICQGLEGVDPSTGESNLERITNESADVLAQIACNVHAFNLDREEMYTRMEAKDAQMAEWEGLFK